MLKLKDPDNIILIIIICILVAVGSTFFTGAEFIDVCYFIFIFSCLIDFLIIKYKKRG